MYIKHQRPCFAEFPNTDKRVENRMPREVFFTNLEVSRNVNSLAGMENTLSIFSTLSMHFPKRKYSYSILHLYFKEKSINEIHFVNVLHLHLKRNLSML